LAKLIKPIVEERRLMKKNGDKKDLLDILLESRDEDGWKAEDEDIVDMMIGFVLAGHEATATGMMWSIIYLTQNPHILKKAKVNN
jgi:ent-kaurenoic acid hydroxylase